MDLFKLSFWDLVPWSIVALWLIYVTLLAVGIRKRQVLRATKPVTLRRGTPRVTLLVAARNEKACIERCLRSLVVQSYSNLEIIAINDRSTDETGAIMDRLAAEFPLLRTVHVDDLPSGWFGKTHALHVGTQSATGEWLCYVDADCELISTNAVSLAVQEAQERGADLLSLTPRFILHSAWEQMTVPVCSSLMVIWFQPARVNNPKLSTSYANGAFLMMTRYCHDRIGGWCRFRNQISEDIALARAVKSDGLRLVVLENDGLYRARMYDSVRASWNGWSRIFYGALPRRALLLSISRLVVCSILPTWALLFCAVGAVASPWSLTASWNGLIAATAVAVALQQVYSAMIFYAVGGRIRWSLTAPIGHLILLGMLGRALFNHFGWATTQWSGSVFRRGQLVTARRPTLASRPVPVTPAR